MNAIDAVCMLPSSAFELHFMKLWKIVKYDSGYFSITKRRIAIKWNCVWGSFVLHDVTNCELNWNAV